MSTKHIAWSLRIRDRKDWKRWNRSKEYNSFEELLAASKDWLEQHPNEFIQFSTRAYWCD